MPRNGKLVRITVALAAAALLGALAVASAGAAGKRSAAGSLSGAGSSLIAPAVQGVWAPMYQSIKGVQVNYASIGSGAGIAQISARTVDFGASDAPMSKSQNANCHGCVQVPWALTATIPVYNIPGVGDHQLRLTGAVLAKIYLGHITKWNDPAIKSINKGLNLPNTSITVAHRSDGSGDSYVFTHYLSQVSKEWKAKVNYATSVSWPTGVGGKGNSGVAGIIRSTPGSIGYVSDFYAIQNHIAKARLKNRAGSWVLPKVASIEAAAQLVKSEKIPKNNAITLTDPPKSKKFRNAWPISTFTYVIIPQKTAKAADLKAWISFALGSKAQSSIVRDVFAPMPKVVIAKAKQTLKSIHS